jgi:hypothetical protein
MADDGASGASGSESATIEINIKTLESQVHKLRVEKNVIMLLLFSTSCRFPVPVLESEEWTLLYVMFLDELIASFSSSGDCSEPKGEDSGCSWDSCGPAAADFQRKSLEG